MAAISDQDMNAMLAEESRQHTVDFNVNSALQELYNYAERHNEQLMMALEEDEFSTKQRLAFRLEQVRAAPVVCVSIPFRPFLVIAIALRALQFPCGRL